MKIIHLPYSAGGNPQGLAAAERSNGYESKSLVFRQNYLNYSADLILYRKNPLLNFLKRWHLILFELLKYDVIHYNYGSFASPAEVRTSKKVKHRFIRKLYNILYAKPLTAIDLKIISSRKKVIAVTFQGTDSRLAWYCKQHYPIHFIHEEGIETYYTDPGSDRLREERVKLFEQYADLIYSVNPDLLNTLPRKSVFIPYASVDVMRIEPIYPSNNGNLLHFVHAPSNQIVKGTRYIESAIAHIRSSGYRFKYTRIENLSNEDALKVYRTADVLIDQLLAGWYGALSVELMALGKPVICYIRKEDLKWIPKEMADELPIINATPDTIERVLIDVLESRYLLVDIGIRCRKFSEKWHDPMKISSITTADYRRIKALKDKL